MKTNLKKSCKSCAVTLILIGQLDICVIVFSGETGVFNEVGD